jgi:hypothetical protein
VVFSPDVLVGVRLPKQNAMHPGACFGPVLISYTHTVLPFAIWVISMPGNSKNPRLLGGGDGLLLFFPGRQKINHLPAQGTPWHVKLGQARVPPGVGMKARAEQPLTAAGWADACQQLQPHMQALRHFFGLKGAVNIDVVEFRNGTLMVAQWSPRLKPAVISGTNSIENFFSGLPSAK